ncbi:SDR family NAD(P)-dependent oxidoreductase [Glaciihabitans sp. dw_435]|uniref:SDR family NAD(P)-dependent oxidoreductase n=1 Tax=Glaciihabitans sp. dw_435 TaxID=2720081 RepID=UPI001BD54A16|nr:SDR family NAD(P)-dependent oxidoreductase [Glaciihabitans sp. dw_435]
MHRRRHRFVLVNWIAVYPVITLVLWLLTPVLKTVPLPVETLLVSALLVTVMNYAVMPNMTRLFRFWLHPRNAVHHDDQEVAGTQATTDSTSASDPRWPANPTSSFEAQQYHPPAPRLKAFVTGASSGIGESLSRQLADRGYDLVLVARREERLAALRQELVEHVDVEILVADLSEHADIEVACARLRRGDVDLLVSNAGASGYELFTQTDEQTLQRNWQLNTTASLLLARAAVPSMVKHDRGGVILVASGLAFSGGNGRPEQRRPHRTLYASAKAAVEVFGRTLAEELHATNVTVTVLCPRGPIRSGTAERIAKSMR